MQKKLDHDLDDLTFYLTLDETCSYLPEKEERKIFTKLDNEHTANQFDALSQRGFRRSQNVAYIPACQFCDACRSARILVNEFEFSKSRKRILSKNKFIRRKIVDNHPTKAQFDLFKKYLDARHLDGDMSDMDAVDYARMVTDSMVNTKLFEYYMPDDDGKEKLIACALSDLMRDGISMVYSFFDPELSYLSLGNYMILDHIEYVKSKFQPFVYLGYYVEGSPKMAYKADYKPQEQFIQGSWQRID